MLVIKVKRICELGHEEAEMTLTRFEEVLAEEQGRYLIVKDNKLVRAVDVQDGDVIMLVPKVAGG